MRTDNYRHWTPDLDGQLMDGIASGLSIEKSGKRLGLTKGSAIGRFNRLKQQMGWQAS
ncbi:hypothetical protein OSJ57_24845 [Sphingomonas sp. HH69]